MFGNGLKKKLLNELDLANNEQVRELADALATLEANRQRALAAHVDALDVDVDVPDVPTKEERVEQLVALVEARVSGDPWDYWVEYLAPAALENPDRAVSYRGMDADEWERRIKRWADIYHEQLNDVDVDDRDLAARHVRNRFGVDLATFEEIVVGWDPAEVLESTVAGPMQEMTQVVVDVTEAVEHTEEPDE